MTQKNYIRAWRNFRGLKQSDLGQLAGVSRNTIITAESGKVSDKVLSKISRALDIPAGMLLTSPEASVGNIDPCFHQDLVIYDKSLTIPLLTSIPAGDWKEWIDSYPAGYGEGTVPRMGLEGNYLFALRVEGDSMMPVLRTGDIIYVNPEKPFERSGSVGVVKFNGNYKIRRVFHRGGNYLLIPENDNYEQETIPVKGTTVFMVVYRSGEL